MRIGLMGLKSAGKKTLFGLLTGSAPSAIPPSGLPGVFRVQDPRVDALSHICKPEKTTYAQLDVLLLPDVEKTEGKAAWLADCRDLDGMAFVVRGFEAPSVFHPLGSVDPGRDAEIFLSELLFSDLLLLEKRSAKLKDELRTRKLPDKERELALVERVARSLEAGSGVAGAGLSEAERRLLASYEFLTIKPAVAVLNAAHGTDPGPLADGLAKSYGGRLAVAACDLKLEAEIAALSDPAERKDFLDGLGITEPAVARLTRVLYDAMGLMSFFTIGEDEVRAWTVRQGSTAPQAARAIHSDLEKGFIRAEVMSYGDVVALGSEAAVQAAGKALLKGKDYVVREGDIMSIRAS